MTRLIGVAHRVAAALAVIFLGLAILLGSRYLGEHGGWDVISGSDDLITLMLLVLGAVLAGSFALLRPGRRNPTGARLTSIVWTIALLVCLIFTWNVIVISDRWVDEIGTAIETPQELDAFIAQHADSFAAYDYQIPTGVYLQSFEFLNSNDVEISGFVWQTYGPEIPDHVVRGVILPELVEEAENNLRESWRVEEDGTERIGWYFSGTFRQNFNYQLYPFDRQDVWLRVWPTEAVESVVLVPDFDAYRDMRASSLPGIDAQFVFGGWIPLGSGFSYDLVDYNTDFGLEYGFSGAPDPEFYFNFAIERNFLSPMLEHLVLETAIAILLFLLLLLMARESDDGQERVGLTVFDLIVASAGLLFAVILDHNAIRGTVESQALTYLEFFPLLLDVFIVLVVLSAVLRVQRWRLPLVGYTGDLMPVLAYWPALLGSLLAVTLVVFFY